MKSPNTSAPRFTCHIVRFWSSLRRDEAPPLSHATTCESCRHFFVSTAQLQQELQRAAHRSLAPSPRGLEERIMASVRVSANPPRRSSVRALQFSLVGSAAAAALTFLVWGRGSFGRASAAPPADVSSTVSELVGVLRTVPANLKQTIEGPAEQLAQNNPLHREIENVYSDARSALDFLALNFLPTSLTTETAELSRQG